MTTQPDYEAKALAEIAGADYFRAELAAALNAAPEDRDLVLIASYKAGVTYALETAQVYATLATLDTQRGELIARIEAIEDEIRPGVFGDPEIEARLLAGTTSARAMLDQR